MEGKAVLPVGVAVGVGTGMAVLMDLQDPTLVLTPGRAVTCPTLSTS